MAVCCQAYSVIVRNAALEERLLGGLRAFQELCPNLTFCTDGYISRIGFLHVDDAKGFVSWLAESGLVKEGLPIDFAIVSPALGNLSGPDWLVFGVFQGNPIGWLAGTERANLFIPTLEFEQKSKLEAISIKDLKQLYDFVGVQENVEDYVHKMTGHHLYIGRTTDRSNVGAEQMHSDSNDALSRQSRWWHLWKRIYAYFYH